jgi:hypothetical protein
MIDVLDMIGRIIEPSDKDASMPEQEYTVPRLPPQQIRDERLKVSVDMLRLALKDVGTLPTRQQEDVREAVRRLQRVQAWCATHPGMGGDAP